MVDGNEPDPPSKSAVRKAGSRLRRIEDQLLNGEAVDDEYRAQQIKIIEQYRAQFQSPMNSMNSSLRSYLNSVKVEGRVTQRLKRMPTIIDKVVRRERGIDLSRMRDIGGCRVVTTEMSTRPLYLLADHIEKKNNDCKRIDYIKEPRRDGYRALHLEVTRNGLRIEVQLRNPNMHRWAEAVEAFGDVLGEDFKQAGDTSVHRFMRLQMEIDTSIERGLAPDPRFVVQQALLRDEISDLLKLNLQSKIRSK